MRAIRLYQIYLIYETYPRLSLKHLVTFFNALNSEQTAPYASHLLLAERQGTAEILRRECGWYDDNMGVITL